ncbi:MAG TPA: hypothetical protein VIX86_03770, partial [Streptosporangiaceae bacterium]
MASKTGREPGADRVGNWPAVAWNQVAGRTVQAAVKPTVRPLTLAAAGLVLVLGCAACGGHRAAVGGRPAGSAAAHPTSSGAGQPAGSGTARPSGSAAGQPPV